MEELKIKKYQSYERGDGKIDIKEHAKYIEEFTKEIFKKEFRIDYGRSADVFMDEYNECCYKVITRYQNEYKNILLKPEEEASFLEELQEIRNGIQVPKPIFSIEASLIDSEKKIIKNKGIISMEKINGVSIKDIISGKNDLPESFNIDTFFQELENFISKMNNEKNIYHRDIHEGNIMIDYKTGKPWVIDFGRSYKKILTDEDPYITDSGIHLPNDIDQVKKLKKIVLEHLFENQKLEQNKMQPIYNEYNFSFNDIKRVNIKENISFNQILNNSIKEMKENNLNEISIKDYFGLYLVKNNTSEFKKREKESSILYPKLIDNEKYFICRK